MQVYVAAIDGAACGMPLPAKHLGGDQYEFLENDEFDPDDRSTLLEFLPRDIARCSRVDGRLTATELVSSPRPDREYWTVLYRVVAGTPPSREDVSFDVLARIRRELSEEGCWHYPQIRLWATG
jgi:hypothetical protein